MYFRLKISKADKLFSKVIRTRSNWTCERCKLDCIDNKGYLDCSHYFSRAKRSVRFDLDNAAALCKRCHDYMGKNPRDHDDFFLDRLGPARFDLLAVRAVTPQKVDEKLVIQGLKIYLEELRKMDETIGKRAK